METVQTETDQTEDKQASDDQNETVPDTKAQLNEHEPSSEGKGTATPIENPAVDSPNLTGTAVKNAANMDKSDVKFYGSKKRLFPPCEDSVCNSPINVVDVSRSVYYNCVWSIVLTPVLTLKTIIAIQPIFNQDWSCLICQLWGVGF